MLLANEWKEERETLHHLSQILGKHTLVSKFKQPQWAHIVLGITTTGFSTGMLYYNDRTYTISVNLRDNKIEIDTENGSYEIALQDGKSIKEYDKEIEEILAKDGIDVVINKKPQETVDRTPFNQDTKHSHYKPEFAQKILELLHFAMKVESKFISKYRVRKVHPGLFWGTFDISCLINYNKIYKSFNESKVIEYNAFDEHFIEFGFWFGDDNFKGPTFFILPHPFVGEDFKCDSNFPEKSRFDKNLKEFVYEVDEMNNETARDIVAFLDEGYRVFKDHLGWKETSHCEIPLDIEDNKLEKSFNL